MSFLNTLLYSVYDMLPLINSSILLFFAYYVIYSKRLKIELKVSVVKSEYKAKTYHLVAFLIFLLLVSIIVFVNISSYKLLFMEGKQEVSDASFSMLQLFIAIFGITLAIIGFWSYTSIKDHAVLKAGELAEQRLDKYDKAFKDFINNFASNKIGDKLNYSDKVNTSKEVRKNEKEMKNE